MWDYGGEKGVGECSGCVCVGLWRGGGTMEEARRREVGRSPMHSSKNILL